jgi:hypothetical protein
VNAFGFLGLDLGSSPSVQRWHGEFRERPGAGVDAEQWGAVRRREAGDCDAADRAAGTGAERRCERIADIFCIDRS